MRAELFQAILTGLAAIAVVGNMCLPAGAASSTEDVAFIDSLVDVLGPANCTETDSSYGCLFQTEAAQSGGNPISLYIGTHPGVGARNIRFGLGGSEFTLESTQAMLDRLIKEWGADTAQAITDSSKVWNEEADAAGRASKPFTRYIWSGSGPGLWYQKFYKGSDGRQVAVTVQCLTGLAINHHNNCELAVQK